MTTRSECNCPCHTARPHGAWMHFVPCCDPDPQPTQIEADGVAHSAFYYDRDRNKPLPNQGFNAEHS